GAVFGGLVNCPLNPTPKRKYQGTYETFVFTTLYGAPRLFRPTGANRYFYMCLNNLLALGGGGNFALCLDEDLLNGTSGRCDTFGNQCLAHEEAFALKNVELWVTGETLTLGDLVPLKTGKVVKPRPVQAASIPGMLGMFQNEWDALVLSAFASEQQLHTTRQELSHCLYQVLGIRLKICVFVQ
nr:hypothetical protein [Tanacetum cinerariifolium]